MAFLSAFFNLCAGKLRKRLLEIVASEFRKDLLVATESSKCEAWC